MEVKLRSCCCQLSTLVTVVAIIETVVCLVIATLSVAWVVLPYTVDSYPWLGQSVTVLIISLVVSFCGILSSLLLLMGVRTQSQYLLIPWVVINVLVLLVLLVTGSYLVLFFIMIKEEKDYVLAAVSSSLILLGIFLIFITVLVVQLFIKMKQKQLLVRVASSFRGSRASVNHKYKSSSNTPMSVRSISSIPRSAISRSRSKRRMRHHSDQHRNSKFYKVHKFSCQLNLPKNKSKSLEHILDCSPSNSSLDDSPYQQYRGHTKSLPRLRPSTDCPHLYQAGDTSSFPHTDSKSVSIHPGVTEYHYRYGKEGGSFDVSEEVSVDNKVMSNNDDEGSVPAPIFPTEKMISRNEHIMDYYCADGEFIL